MLNALTDKLTNHLNSPLARQRVTLNSAQGRVIHLAQQEYLSFASNDYLGLAQNSQVITALQKGASLWGVGSGAAGLVTGHMQIHQELEQALAAATGQEQAILFTSGYQANLAVLSALSTKGDLVIQDKLNHASLLDGCRLAEIKLRRYAHANTESLSNLLHNNATNTKGLVITEGVFSMDGTLAPLQEISALVANYPERLLFIDDAHGFGVLGTNGSGSANACGVTPAQAPLVMATFGKALGTSGAFVAGSAKLIELLTQFARPYIYSTNLAPALAYATLTSLEVMQQENWRREHLHELIQLFRNSAQQLDWELLPSQTPIQPLIVGSSTQALRLAEHLQQQGIWVTPIRPPTVPQGTARLRITFNATHTRKDVHQLIRALASYKND